MRHGGRWAAVAGAALVVGMGAGCATEADPEALDDVVTDAGEAEAPGVEASASFLAEAGERSSAEPYRVSMSMTMSVSGADDEATEDYGFDGEVMTGAQDGDAYEFHMDMGGPMADMGLNDTEEFADADLSMDLVGDAETAYIRAPIFAQMADTPEGGGVDDWMTQVAELGDRWGRIDLTALDDVAAADVQGSMGGPGMGDPAAMLDVLTEAADTEDLGTDVIDGVEVHGTRFELPFNDLAGGEGYSPTLPDDPADQGPADEGLDDEATALAETLLLGDVPVEAWVDDEGYVRRLSYEIDMGEALGALGEPPEGESGPPEGFSMVVGSTIDFSDYGDPGIEIVFPDPSETVDVTEAFRAMAEGG